MRSFAALSPDGGKSSCSGSMFGPEKTPRTACEAGFLSIGGYATGLALQDIADRNNQLIKNSVPVQSAGSPASACALAMDLRGLDGGRSDLGELLVTPR